MTSNEPVTFLTEMIDTVYYRANDGALTGKAKSLRRRRALSWTCSNPAVRELLDYVAAELAEEFVRLMRKDMKDSACSPKRKDGG